MTMGAIQAIKDAGRTELLGYLVGEGGQYLAIQAVVNGDIARETQTPPYFGAIVIENVKKLLAGQQVAAQQLLPVLVFDADKKQFAQNYLASITAKGLKF